MHVSIYMHNFPPPFSMDGVEHGVCEKLSVPVSASYRVLNTLQFLWDTS